MNEPKKILLVEDDLFLRDLYTELLTTESYAVSIAIDGEEALHKIKSDTWDLVLLDVNLPKINGVDVLKQIHETNPQRMPKLIIFLTSSEEARSSDELLEFAQDYLIKTEFTPDTFITKIHSYLQG